MEVAANELGEVFGHTHREGFVGGGHHHRGGQAGAVIGDADHDGVAARLDARGFEAPAERRGSGASDAHPRDEVAVRPLHMREQAHPRVDGLESNGCIANDVVDHRFGLLLQHRADRVDDPSAVLHVLRGVALGVDRLLMAMLGTTSIADVIAFPLDRS